MKTILKSSLVLSLILTPLIGLAQENHLKIQKLDGTPQEHSFNVGVEKMTDSMKYRFNPDASFGISVQRGIQVGFKIKF
ncbi:MAG: hypothetical protein JNK65_09545 [Deltaproteobacteria bacterium]|nr:hypothetical protein [Deltaproteobacteria bacterium]